MLRLETQDGISVLRMEHGKANAQDLELCNALTDRMAEIEALPSRAVVITGHGRFFSGGVDLKRVVAGGVDYLREFMPALVRCFESGDVAHVSGRVSPLDDIETVETELLLADLEQAERAWDRAAKAARAGGKEARMREAMMARTHAHLAAGRPLRSLETSVEEASVLATLSPLTAKPVLYVANVAEDGFGLNPPAEAVETRARAEGAAAVRVSAAVESELAGLDEADRAEYLAAMGVDESGLARFVHAAYALLGLQTFFTTGPKEARAWTLRRGSTAVQAAGVIHSDFERGFVRAEVVGYEDFVELGGEQGAKAAGRWRLEGRDYVVAEGDVVRFRFAV